MQECVPLLRICATLTLEGVLTNKNPKNQYYNTVSSLAFVDPLRILLAEDIKFLYDPHKKRHENLSLIRRNFHS